MTPAAPALARTRAELAERVQGLRAAGRRIAFVPTMGALHAGHVACLRAAAAGAGPGAALVVSIFVNPLQFAAGEDLERYPRDVAGDLEVCAREGVAVVFAPQPAEVYPSGTPQVTVSAGPVGELFEGASRPGHFDGVLTVVAKLAALVRPDVSAFGEKDAQQLYLVRRLAADLDVPLGAVVAVPTVREPDGLAASSRNRYLSESERRRAQALPAALAAARRALGEAAQWPATDHRADAASAACSMVLAAATAVLAAADGVALDYCALVDDASFTPLTPGCPPPGQARLLLAARVGATRLIDNAVLAFAPTQGAPCTARC